jgi:hypothetical protein
MRCGSRTGECRQLYCSQSRCVHGGWQSSRIGRGVVLPLPGQQYHGQAVVSGGRSRPVHSLGWVAELGTFLRANGNDARLDQWHLRKGMDLPQWMANEVELAERVVIISDSRYRDRADKRTGGVGWETMLIQGDMAQQSPDSRKYLIIVREDQFKDGVPIYLKTKFSIHWKSNGEEAKLRDDLLKELYDVELAPPLGSPPSLYVSG